ncbi:MAG: hypothetical protein EAZ07_03415 [Cytophagales bacterium]|nr:MAG: hypothetical protein EAZ07_03415 [Cytophagales bacterium]
MMKIKLLFLILFTSIVNQITIAQTINGDTLITKSGLKYIPIKRGDGPRPWPGQKVSIFYSVRFVNAKKIFDSNKGEDPFKFKLGKGEVIPGLDEGIYLMHTNGKMKFIIPSQLAYGKMGKPNPEGSPRYLVPPNTDLIYEVELVDIH